ncbi:MAG: hypothetical protein M3272_05650 [Actinomycetota bacterium]|nr:hypothetical protein [Actinomycetota bacterium]MDQ3926456.1 hypothetical protein [Actinomycetota bacterium]
MNGRYMADENGKRVGVLLGIGGYERLIEELEDIRAYDEAKAELAKGEDELIPFDQAVGEIEEGRVSKDDS